MTLERSRNSLGLLNNMSEEKVFNKLRRLPLDEMVSKLDSITRPPHVYFMGNLTVNRTDYYNDIQFHLERMQCLEQSGWSHEDFLLELEKKSILEQIKDFNDSIQFPTEIIDRAKRFYPNIKYTEASIELE